eukprot:TRINITY_DN84729_c0_g1_i1.p1 TRINITY_DN84729_c0_g1~~TRINITY_DN84729_c0_g1_i1.p1  ORF type:complete len:156 (-),score=32.19 TRINITY_DN84729_c0_g1_i1:258-725(-)
MPFSEDQSSDGWRTGSHAASSASTAAASYAYMSAPPPEDMPMPTFCRPPSACSGTSASNDVTSDASDQLQQALLREVARLLLASTERTLSMSALGRWLEASNPHGLDGNGLQLFNLLTAYSNDFRLRLQTDSVQVTYLHSFRKRRYFKPSEVIWF